MIRPIIPLAVAALAIAGCDKVAVDLIHPWPIQGPAADTLHLQPGTWRTVPPGQDQAQCSYALLRDAAPILWGEVRDSVPTFIYLPESTTGATYSLRTTGCGTWERAL